MTSSNAAPEPPAVAVNDASHPWHELAADYENARSRPDSLDRLVEWPAQREMLGDVAGRSVLDLGCGNGGKLVELALGGATRSVGVDISGDFISDPPAGVEFLHADLNDFDTLPAVAGRTFDRVMLLQSFGYAQDPVSLLQRARSMLTDDGFILLTRTQPLRYALERAERNGTLVGDEYFADGTFDYVSGWNDQITMTKQRYTMAGLLNTLAAAGLWIEAASEPHMTEDDIQRFPGKHEWANKYLVGILIFKLRALPAAVVSPRERGRED